MRLVLHVPRHYSLEIVANRIISFLMDYFIEVSMVHELNRDFIEKDDIIVSLYGYVDIFLNHFISKNNILMTGWTRIVKDYIEKWIPYKSTRIIMWGDENHYVLNDFYKRIVNMYLYDMLKYIDMVFVPVTYYDLHNYKLMINFPEYMIFSHPIYRPFNYEVVDDITDHFKTYNSFNEREYDIIFIGAYYEHSGIERKGVIDVYRFLEKNDGVYAVIVSWYDKFKELPNVVYYRLGTLSEKKIYDLLSNSKYLLYISKFEGFGMPVIDSMAVGTPVIYLDALKYNEFSIGYMIPYSIEKLIDYSMYGKILFRFPDYDTMDNIIMYALRNRERYNMLVNTVSKYAVGVSSPNIIAFMIKKICDIYFNKSLS